MSDAPSSTPDAPKAGKAKGIKGALSKKVGPLPLGVWLLAFGGGLAVAAVIRRRAVANAGAEDGTATEGTGWGWDEPDPGGTTPGVGGNAGNNGGGGTTPPVPPVPPIPDLPDIPEVVIDWLPDGFDPNWRPPVVVPDPPPWQDPPEPNQPGTGGGGGDDLNNGGPTGITRHRYVARSAVDRHCRVCGKWQNTALHTNREPARPDRPGGPTGGGSGGGGGATPADNRPHKWTRKSLTNPACKVCGRQRNSPIHVNPDTPKPPRPPQRPGGATGHPVGGGGGGAGTGNGGGGGGGGNGGGATGGPVSHGVGPADTPHRYKAISANNKHCHICNRWRDTWVHTNRNG